MLNMAEYRLSPGAERDLADIWRYTNKRWGRAQANRYIDPNAPFDAKRFFESLPSGQ